MWSFQSVRNFDLLSTNALGLGIFIVLSYSFLIALLKFIGTRHKKTEHDARNGSKSGQKETNSRYENVKVSKILIHPIKSCRGTSIESSRYTPEGLEYDRIWCIIDASTNATLTAREVPKMVLITPKVIREPASPYGGTLEVSFPEDSGCQPFSIPLKPTEDVLKRWQLINNVSLWGDSSIDGYLCENLASSTTSISETLSRYMERPVHLAYKGERPRKCGPTSTFPDLQASAKYQDGYPLLFLSEENIVAINEEMRSRIGQQGIEEKWRTEEVVVERFRPNIVLSGGGPFAEDSWREVSIGPDVESAEKAPGILVVSKCARCLLPNVSPETGIRDQAVPYKVLMKFRLGIDPENKWKPCVGCNGVPLSEGVIRVGDVVRVKALN
ncbi:hypothetical protein PQX77_015671 [Marasmius sp. AFHP31]|nr:hypothetical protein PQX77_015671 [Marasmius sp. AFHP31]